MAGGFSAVFAQDIMNWVQNSTAAPTAPSTDTFIILYHTLVSDATLITDTGRVGQGSTAFTEPVGNTTNVWTLAGSTTPSSFQNKVVITISTGNFAAPTQTTVRGFLWTEASSTVAGRVLGWGNISPTQTISTGNTIQFSTGALIMSLGGSTTAT